MSAQKPEIDFPGGEAPTDLVITDVVVVITGVVGALLATGGLVLGKLFFIDRLLGGRLISNAIPAVGMGDVLLFVAPLLVVIGAVIATATGYVTLRLYVRN